MSVQSEDTREDMGALTASTACLSDVMQVDFVTS